MRIQTRLLLLALLIPQLSFADIEKKSGKFYIYAPQNSWKVSLPAEGWVVSQRKWRPDGSGFYYMMANKKRLMYFSIFLDKTKKCNSGKSCREMFWRNPGPLYKNPKDVRKYQSNGFQVIRFYLDGVGGTPVKQANISAHMYRDGFWVDIHISRVGREIPDFKPMIQLLKSISVN